MRTDLVWVFLLFLILVTAPFVVVWLDGMR